MSAPNIERRRRSLPLLTICNLRFSICNPQLTPSPTRGFPSTVYCHLLYSLASARLLALASPRYHSAVDTIHLQLATVLGLLVVITLLSLFASRFHIPYPTVMVVAGLGICFIPHLPPVHLDPQAVFLIFLPPLLYAAAWYTSWRDFRANLRPIMMLAVGFVVFTTLAVGAVAHALIPAMPWAAAFTLGAIISPPDAVAATAIATALGIPRRIVTVLEGESLVNDATGLTIYRFAVVAAITGTFSLASASELFIFASIGGVALGWVLGMLVARLHLLLDDAIVETVITLLTPFAAYLIAEAIGVSGVLAVVVAGLYLSRAAPISSPRERASPPSPSGTSSRSSSMAWSSSSSACRCDTSSSRTPPTPPATASSTP